MSLLQQNSRKRITLGQDGNSLVLLIVFNIIIFILLNFLKIVYLVNNSTIGVFQSEVLSWMSLPAQPAVFATRPWTGITYMFTHFEIWDLISSMIWLWGFGYIFQDLTGNKKLIPVYLYGGLAGSIFFLLTINLIPVLRQNVNSVYPLLGSGPSLMAISVACAAVSPKYKVFPMLNIPLWTVTAVFIVIRLATLRSNDYGIAAALIAGGLVGYLFTWQLKRGHDWGQWMTDVVNWADDLFNPEKKHKKTPAKKQLFYKSNQKPYERTPHVTQQRIDDLLDKINIKGYHSLTEEEKEFLKKASKEEL
jgi:membrane associated rhomboid family serine protease